MLVNAWHEFSQKSSVGMHRVTAKRGCFGLRDMLGDVAESLTFSFGEGSAGSETGIG